MTAARGTSNSNQRGSSRSRAIRRQYLLDRFGDGVTVKCTHCPAMLTHGTLTVDRIIPGIDGGTYRRDNIRPSCMPCASIQGGHLRWRSRTKS